MEERQGPSQTALPGGLLFGSSWLDSKVLSCRFGTGFNRRVNFVPVGLPSVKELKQARFQPSPLGLKVVTLTLS